MGNTMSMYRRAGPANIPADTGIGKGQELYHSELTAKQHFAPPTVPAKQDPNNALPAHYNQAPGLPVKYDVPTAAKEHFQNKEQIRNAIQDSGAGQVMRVDPIGDEEVAYLQSMKNQAELADFDRYVNTLIDVRKPGNLKWLMEVYPGYVERRLQQVHTDYEFALRNQMIDCWGINTFDDLHFKYLVDQQKIDGPRLGRHFPASDSYAPGLLSPWSFLAGNDQRGTLQAPFASAEYGAKPRAKGQWGLPGGPLDDGRTSTALAQSMYNPAESNRYNVGMGYGTRDAAARAYFNNRERV